MKKAILFLAFASLLATSAVAQKQLVEDVQKQISSIGTDADAYKAVIGKLTPAFTNAETQHEALTWMVAGKAAYQLFDKNFELKVLGKESNEKEANLALLDGYNYFMKALPLDSVVETNKDGTPKIDKKTGKPKFKTKHSKDILESLLSHANDYGTAGDYFREAQDYANGKKAYGIFYVISNSDYAKSKNNGVALPDTVLGQIKFLEGFCSYFAKDYSDAYQLFTEAKKLNYTQNSINDFWNAAFAYKVQDLLDTKKFGDALTTIDGALANNPNDAFIVDMKGIIVEEQEKENGGDIEKSLPYYLKATELDPNFAQGFLHVGRIYYLRAANIIDNNPDLTDEELAPKVNPICEDAKTYLEKAYTLSKAAGQADSSAKDLLARIYHQLKEDAKADALYAE